MRLKNKVAFVTGAGSGIGRAISQKLAVEGAYVAVVDVNSSAAEETVTLITNEGRVAKAFRVDVTLKNDLEDVIRLVVDTWGTIDVLVNNAGTDIKGRIQDYDVKNWERIMDLNLKGVFLVTQAVVKQMLKQQSGKIINISSIAGKTGETFTSPYCASKFGIIGFTQSIALELGPKNITANVICPGPVETELIRNSIAGTAKLNNRSYEEELNAKFLSRTPLGRLAKPEDIANAVSFLSSDEANFITGVSLNVCGGMELH
ncbi:SDR family NAD(P)-dependent oxidoreductase [Sediminispirochaeta smaragdinae]|uniref:Short-chain dehydrogenase/reductase SDR n=1 Tax=Sediminispirochaeta smaragdinae (strain DSM 11293 / JCM 15392 / SEBR 4228) TaxID=573413 RepID=E1R2I5_SEDSS|nr:SDR family NAD(P)-dependent oxidoreductase [Sediminispirochaeta smaragdinae]ADK82545.1 short-chain dehydrogenase/reductase SDR [Sediminispirochaeta smaragdinae DSM 11293]